MSANKRLPAIKCDSGGAAKSSGQSDQNTSHAVSDHELVALCRHFRCKLAEWINQIEKLGFEDYDDDAQAGTALQALRADWGNSLKELRSLRPRSVYGAYEKLSAAQIFLTFSCEADGSAIELLALATRELDQISDRHPSTGQTQTERRPNAHGPFGWWDRLTRRA